MRFFYLLAMQWNHEKNIHTIHGLWPEYTLHKWPEFCTREVFNISLIRDLIPTMKHVWSSMHEYHNTDEEFWQHEWQKHGTCNFNGWNQHEYFSKTLVYYELHKNECKLLQDCNTIINVE